MSDVKVYHNPQLDDAQVRVIPKHIQTEATQAATEEEGDQPDEQQVYSSGAGLLLKLRKHAANQKSFSVPPPQQQQVLSQEGLDAVREATGSLKESIKQVSASSPKKSSYQDSELKALEEDIAEAEELEDPDELAKQLDYLRYRLATVLGAIILDLEQGVHDYLDRQEANQKERDKLRVALEHIDLEKYKDGVDLTKDPELAEQFKILQEAGISLDPAKTTFTLEDLKNIRKNVELKRQDLVTENEQWTQLLKLLLDRLAELKMLQSNMARTLSQALQAIAKNM